jgi:hypothetical protein
LTIAAERDFSSVIDARISERLPQHSKVGKFPTSMAVTAITNSSALPLMHELVSDCLTTQSRKISYFYGSNSDHEQFCSAIDARISERLPHHSK